MLNDILPRAQLIHRFGTRMIFEEYGKKDLTIIARKEPEKLHHVAANVWNRIVQKKWHSVNPQQFAHYFDTLDPHLHGAISNYLGVEVIRDIYYAKAWKKTPKVTANLVCEMLVAWVYRNDLQLADITFTDTEHPIPKEERKLLQTYKGLGLLGTLLDSLQSKGEELKCEQLTLVAGTKSLVNLFSRYGFSVENSKSGRAGMALGVGIPMERDVTRPE